MHSSGPAPRLEGPGKHYRFELNGLPGTLVGIALGAVGLVLAVVFSLLIAAALLGMGVIFGGWFWWKTREARKLMRERAQRMGQPLEREVEGEVLHIEPGGAKSVQRDAADGSPQERR